MPCRASEAGTHCPGRALGPGPCAVAGNDRLGPKLIVPMLVLVQRREMSESTKLRAVMAIHTVIYLTMAVAVLYTLYAGWSKNDGALLRVSLGLLAIEGVVFSACGMRCPLTALAKTYGRQGGYVGDSFVPERYARHTFRVFGAIMSAGLLLLALNYLGLR